MEESSISSIIDFLMKRLLRQNKLDDLNGALSSSEHERSESTSVLSIDRNAFNLQQGRYESCIALEYGSCQQSGAVFIYQIDVLRICELNELNEELMITSLKSCLKRSVT